ncbi:armadillo-type protein [Russula earlei]|uniref:Armadillo-type protein n=1 Tax=Russula earlei TaxID=71964 RepID=A0ACC0UEN4_9AGAM|nr:armadillo-type protein [Russula earlei]
MDYLRTLGTAAVSSIVQKSGLNLPFSLGKKHPPLGASSIWTLYDATKRDDGTFVSVFEFNSQQRRNLLPTAQNAVRRLRVTRHPDILKFMDAVEADGIVYIMTERVKSLSVELPSWEGNPVRDRQDWLLWGLHRITNALSFINTSCNASHGTVGISSIFLSVSGEWKLGGFELFSDPTEPNAILIRGGWAALKDGPVAAIDAYALALLTFNLFNPTVLHPSFLDPPYNPPQPSTRGTIPLSLWPSFKNLGENGGFFKGNKLLKICEGLESFGLMTDGERPAFLRIIKDAAPTLPSTFATHLVLPALLTSLTHTSTSISAPSIVPLVIQLSTYVSSSEFKSLVLEPVVKLFANPDRGTRMALLDALPEFADKLDKQTVSEKIWPHLQTGFTDTVPVIRETTVKTIDLLSDKFTERILNNELLRHLARLQSDSEASIRTNSIILIGRLGPTLGYNTRRKVLGAACAKALKDNFAPARVAALMACMACANLFEVDELAGKVVGLVATALVDKEKTVRDQAFKAVAMFVQILEEHAKKMPETTLAGDGSSTPGLGPPDGSTETTLVSSAAGAAGALAGWAISSIGKKFAPTDMQAAITPVGDMPPPVANGTKPTLSNQSSAPPVPNGSRPRGMQLGTHKASQTALPGELAEEARWGGDLMDVNADEDDWNGFESATTEFGDSNLIGMGRGSVPDDEDPWAAFEDPAPPPVPIPVTELTSLPIPPSAPARGLATQGARLPRLAAQSPSPSPLATSPVASPASVPSTAGMTKEEKAAEMARRKDERKQRIAQLKEQKKNAAGAKP